MCCDANTVFLRYGALQTLIPISGDLGTIVRLSLDQVCSLYTLTLMTRHEGLAHGSLSLFSLALQFVFSPLSIAFFLIVILASEGRQAQITQKLKTVSSSKLSLCYTMPCALTQDFRVCLTGSTTHCVCPLEALDSFPVCQLQVCTTFPTGGAFVNG